VNPREFITVVGGVSYRPGWKLEAQVDYMRPGFVRVVLEALVDDAYGGPGSRRIGVMMHRALSAEEIYHFDVPRVLDWVRRSLFMEMEDHESREFFKYNGERVFDPHKGHGV
jgi:hypothetical protein